MMLPITQTIITVTLNPTIDRIVEVPGFRPGGHQKGRLRSRLPAGKAINVARALTSLDVSGTATGWVGRDAADEFDRFLTGHGVRPALLPIEGATRENVTVVDPAVPQETHIRETGPAVSDEEIQVLIDHLAAMAGESRLFVFTGSAAPGLPPQRFGELLDLCTRRGTPVVVDAAGEMLRVALERPLMLIKPNLQELSEALGERLDDDADVIREGYRLAGRGGMLIVTLGSRGAYGFAGEQAWFGSCPVTDEQVRSTVGCGDALLAGFLAAGTRTSALEDALADALAVAAASAMTDEPATFDADDLAECRRNVSVRAV
jgi:1-phosphofructokinase